jgi:hypothetical protein
MCSLFYLGDLKAKFLPNTEFLEGCGVNPTGKARKSLFDIFFILAYAKYTTVIH